MIGKLEISYVVKVPDNNNFSTISEVKLCILKELFFKIKYSTVILICKDEKWNIVNWDIVFICMDSTDVHFLFDIVS